MFDDPEYSLSTDSYGSAFPFIGCMDCTKHMLEVKSETKQNVYIGAHVWQERGYSDHWSCLEASGDGTIQHEIWYEQTGSSGTSV